MFKKNTISSYRTYLFLVGPAVCKRGNLITHRLDVEIGRAMRYYEPIACDRIAWT